MEFDFITLLIVVGGSALLALLAYYLCASVWQRLFSIGFLGGLMIYSGIGIAYPEVPWSYLYNYFILALSFILAFKFFCTVFLDLGQLVGQRLPDVLNQVDRTCVWNIILLIYVGLHIVPLLHPEFRLYLLWSPPVPDLVSHFAQRWIPGEQNLFLRVIGYMVLLIGPFFYMALYRYRYKISFVVLIFCTILYFRYIADGYLGRGDLVMVFATILIAIWVSKHRYRKLVVLIVILLIPAFFVGSYYYQVIRMGGTVGEVHYWQAISSVLATETGFLRDSGILIIEGNYRVDLGDYFKWVLTLPIPKIITGEIAGARVNYEISEYVLGKAAGSPGFYVILPGLVAESFYIYGRFFFWIHGIFIAFLAAFVVRLVERTDQLLFLNAYLVALFSYYLNRGGIAGLLPIITNEFLLFYFFVFVIAFRMLPTRKSLISYNV